MKSSVFFLIIFAFITVKQASAQKVTKLWESEAVLPVPESVLFADSVLYVSCIDGTPINKDGQGAIAKLSLDGKILNSEWASGLDAPKGMGVFKNKLYVTNITQVVIIDITNGKILERVNIPETAFLNDIAIDKEGNVYISDSQTSCIFKMNQMSQVTLFSNGEHLKGANGLWIEKEKLYAGAGGNILVFNPANGEYSIYIQGTGGVDGLEQIDEARMLFSDWSGNVYIGEPGNEKLTLIKAIDEKYNAADLDYNRQERIFYIPTFFGNTVAAYKLEY